jgi:molecular chaperone HscC
MAAPIGIDLGTTNSLVAAWIDGRAQILPNVLGEKLTPSVVGLDDDGTVLVGQAAKERLVSHPALTVHSFKRYMGTDRLTRLGSREFRPEELSALVLRSLKADAEAFLGEDIEEAVVSVPAYFNDVQRKATRAAGELAGLHVERLINEPTAAAIAYGLHESEKETTFLVLDLGGGTFDVSVLELFDGVMEVHASAGDNFLGGEDVTELLAARFLRAHSLETEALSLREKSLLYKQAERCKKRLSSADSAEMKLSAGGRLLESSFTRSEMEEGARELIDRMRKPIERAMRDAKKRTTDLDAVVLVGGATRMPFVRALAAKMFGKFPLSNVDPEETVAIGAEIQAGLKARDRALSEVVLTDCCPYSLGVDVARRGPTGRPVGAEFLPIIERNTVVPTSREERLCTVHDGQTVVDLNIYQGESRNPSHNVHIGFIQLPVPPGKAGEQEVVVRFTYDINGLLEVEATVSRTGLRKAVVIERNPGLLSKEEIEKRLQALATLKIHPRDRMENRAVLARGERLFEESLGPERELVRSLLAHFESVIDRQDPREIEKVRREVAGELDRLDEEGRPW